MATQTALAYIGGALERLAAADVLGVGAGVIAQAAGANGPFALDAKGSGDINIGAGAGTGATNIATGAGMGAVAISRAGITATIAGLLAVTGTSAFASDATFTGVVNTNNGVQRSTAGTLAIGTGASTSDLTVGRTGITTTFPGSVSITQNLVVTGTETITGAQTFTGLMTVTSSASAGVAGAVGPEELVIETTEAATAVATIKNAGYLDFSARTWETTGPSSTTQKFGRLGAVIDTITAATGAPLTYRLVWTNTAGTIQWSADESGLTRQAGVLDSSLTPNGALYAGASGRLTSTAALTHGQLLVGSTGAAPVAATLTAPAAGITITGGAGSITFALANDLAAVEGLGAIGMAARTAADTWAVRTLAGTANQIIVTNGDGVAGAPTFSTPQDIHTAASPTFANLTLGAGGDITSIDEIAFADGAANATATGRMRRNAAALTWHDGTAARTMNFLEVAQTISARKSHTATLALADGAAVEGLGHGGWTADATAGQQVLVGDAVALSTTASTVRITDATTSGTDTTATCLGVWDGTDVVSLGTVNANFVTGLTLAVGAKCYLSPGAGVKRGCWTNEAPSVTGEFSTVVGYVVNTTGRALYAGATAEPVAEGTAWPDALSARVFVIAGRAPVKV